MIKRPNERWLSVPSVKGMTHTGNTIGGFKAEQAEAFSQDSRWGGVRGDNWVGRRVEGQVAGEFKTPTRNDSVWGTRVLGTGSFCTSVRFLIPHLCAS
ncbi:MAG: hypothetical protein JWO71_540 [Candidatus Acidoferrum typicum]|nr:hypothetical protein [Candidatus Acidoferrum typicum]